jgi:hypothetical protein
MHDVINKAESLGLASKKSQGSLYESIAHVIQAKALHGEGGGKVNLYLN